MHGIMKKKIKKYKFYPTKNRSSIVLENPRYYVYYPLKLPKDIKNSIKFSIQRIKYGYCESDTYTVFSLFENQLPEMLRTFASNLHSTPYNMTEKEWRAELNYMAALLEESSEEHSSIKNKYEDLLMTEAFRDLPKEKQEEVYKKYCEESINVHEAKVARRRKAFELLYKHYENLWD